jgi:hypothetical protein
VSHLLLRKKVPVHINHPSHLINVPDENKKKILAEQVERKKIEKWTNCSICKDVHTCFAFEISSLLPEQSEFFSSLIESYLHNHFIFILINT